MCHDSLFIILLNTTPNKYSMQICWKNEGNFFKILMIKFKAEEAGMSRSTSAVQFSSENSLKYHGHLRAFGFTGMA